ncbi:MAG: hypothetical protein KDK78_08460, partial [Chlamydiia bacterium]|nr:hypothetical protein [Chlamydiia bacterium]
TTNIEHIRAVLNTSSYLSAEAFIAQFDDASIEALSPGERLRAWSLGLNSRAFTHKERMHWGDTTVKANRLALRLFGVHVEGNRITTEELPDAHSKKYLVKWIHRAPFFDYGSASGVQQFYVSSLLVSNWLRRNGTPPHMKALEGYVSEHLRRKPRDHQHDGILLDVFAQGILPWNSYAHHLLKDRLHGCSGVKWVRETNQLRLYASRPYVLQDARMAARLAAPLAGLDFSGWVGEGILSLLLSLPCTKRDAITSLSLTNVQQISKDDFRAVLQLLPRIASLTIRGSAAQDWPDIWEILKEHAQGIQSLVIGGAGAQHFQKRLGWPLEHSEACVPGVLEWHRGAEDTIRNILLKRRDYSLWERLTPSLQIGILGHILRPTLCDLSYCFEDLIQLRTACSHLPRETLQLIDSRIEGLTGKRTIALTGGMLDADASRSAICFLRDKNPKELRLKGDWRDQGYILSELLQAMHPTQTLVLENIQLDHPCIKALSSSALSLLGLEITSWTESEELLVELLSQCKSVRSLAFTSCPTLSPHIYTTLDAHCPQLRKLKVRNCPALEAVSFWSPLGLPSGCMAPIQAIARDPASIRKLVLMIQGEDPWIDAHLPLVLDLLATLPTDDVCNIFLWEHNVRGEGAAEVHAFCRRLIRMGCKGKSKALRDRFMRLPVLEIPSPLDPQLLQWLAKPPKRNSIVIHSLDPTDVPLLLEHPFHCKRLDLPDTVLSQENAQALLDTGCELVQSSGPSFWHKPWPGLPEDLASINLLEAMR